MQTQKIKRIMKKKQLQQTINILERQAFLDVYNEFDRWIVKSVGFRTAKIGEGSAPADNNVITSEINTLYGVEHYIIDALQLSLRFARERNKHIFYITEGFFSRSEALTVEEFKADIIKQVGALRENKIEQLNKLLVVN